LIIGSLHFLIFRGLSTMAVVPLSPPRQLNQFTLVIADSQNRSMNLRLVSTLQTSPQGRTKTTTPTKTIPNQSSSRRNCVEAGKKKDPADTGTTPTIQLNQK
jgi:hypothetical protein